MSNETPFIHLRSHTEFSLQDGLVRVSDCVAFAKQEHMFAIGVTDLSNLFALVKFYKKATAAGVKPIVGADVVLREGKLVSQATLLCMNDQGYAHLKALLSQAYLQGQEHDGTPQLQWTWLQANNAGLIVLSGGRRGNVGQALLHNDVTQAEVLARRWQDTFPDRFYIELTRTLRDGERDYLHQAIKLAQQLNLPVVATNDVRFVHQEDFDAHEARVCIHAGYMLDDPKRPRHYSSEQYFKSAQQMQALFADIPEALANSVAIAKRCNVKLTLGQAFLPDFPVPEGMTLEVFLREQAQRNLAPLYRKIKDNPIPLSEYQQRLDIELDVINSMGFPGYFLIVADFIRWAKCNDIPVGPGRGSGAGSLVAYCLGITMLDPMEHQLLFERFLNPERVSMPDFDVDFCMDRRDEVIEYVADHYGHDAVSQIITYGTMAAKAVVRDVGRVLGYPYGLVDTVAKLIPFELGITLAKALQQEEVLRERYETEEEIQVLIDLAMKLEGVARNAGKHAGGVVIAPNKITDFAPIYCEVSGEHPVTQFDKDDVEAVGLVKFDFLGLRTLTIIHWAVQAVNARLQREGEERLDIDSIPMDDSKTFTLLQACATTAVFQLESRGMKDLVKRLQPHSFEEITALVALFRPGPLQSGMVDDFIDRKHGRAQVVYPHPDLAPILSPTYGVILYQEQVMQIAQVLAQYSLGGADILRRAMGKKKPEEMAKQREVFCQGAIERQVDEKVAMHIFDLMEKFAGYGFNKSHSAAYALVAYQTAYLKAHYPAEFMAAVLSSDMDNTDKVVGFLDECKAMGLTVLPPDINAGQYCFCVNEQQEIVYGLGAIKGVGQAACDHVIEQRDARGRYTSLFDLCERVDLHKVSRRVLEPLIRCGSLDGFDIHRASLMASVDKAILGAEQKQKNQARGQGDMFAFDVDSPASMTLDYVKAAEYEKAVQLQAEKDTLGFYLSGHPFDLFVSEAAAFSAVPINQLTRYINKKAKFAGLLMSVRQIFTKSGRKMAVLAMEDNSEKLEVAVFSRLLPKVIDKLEVGKVLVVQGNIERDDFNAGVRVVCETVNTLVELRGVHAKHLKLKLHDHVQVEELLAQLPLLMKPFCGGRCGVVISYKNQKAQAEIRLGNEWRVNPESELIKQLRHCCGEPNVLLEY